MARKNLTREIILAATLKLIEEKGSITNLNFREIARELGCAHTSLYNFFPSYSALLHEAAHTIMLDMRKVLSYEAAEKVADGTYENLVIAYIGSVAQYALAHRGWYRFLWMDTYDVDLNQVFKDQPRPEHLLLAMYQEAYGNAIAEEEALMRLNIGHGYMHGELCKFLSQRNQENDPERFTARILKQVRWLLSYNIH